MTGLVTLLAAAGYQITRDDDAPLRDYDHSAIAALVRGWSADTEEKTMTNAITDTQIEALMSEAGASGDPGQVAVCLAALGHDGPEAGDEYGDPMPIDEARAECARVIAEARAAACDELTRDAQDDGSYD